MAIPGPKPEEQRKDFCTLPVVPPSPPKLKGGLQSSLRLIEKLRGKHRDFPFALSQIRLFNINNNV